jgi:hypothetical protein
MSNGRFQDGTEQEFYFPPGHPQAGWFKGMANILRERGFENTSRLKAQCGKKFSDCPSDDKDSQCCCCRILFNQPDFANIESLLEIEARAQGFEVFFLPKFHPELNPIEQCWGYGKRTYCLFPPSSKEEDLERNVVDCPDKADHLSNRTSIADFSSAPTVLWMHTEKI